MLLYGTKPNVYPTPLTTEVLSVSVGEKTSFSRY